MTTENLRICIQKAMNILPIQLEIAKREMVLTPEEDDEFRNTLQNTEVGKELTAELIKLTERQSVNRQNIMKQTMGEYNRVPKIGKDHLNMDFRFLGDKSMMSEVIEEIVKDPKYQGFNPYSNPDKAMRIIAVKMFQKVLGNEDVIESIMEKSFDDPRIKEDMEKFKQDLK